MSHLIGALLAILACGAAISLRHDQDRWFYPAPVGGWGPGRFNNVAATAIGQ